MTIMIGDVQAAVHAMSAKLYDGHVHDLVGFSIRGASHPYIEVHDGVIHMVVMERGVESQQRTTTEDLDEALHWIALYATSTLAIRWELDQRDRWPADRDSRIGWNAKQVELLRRLDARWAEEFRAGIPAQCPGVRLEDVDAHPLTYTAEARDAEESLLARYWRKLRTKLREPY
ncbi:Imm63 family immunity protein [Streptomyces noboritoensis]|uniref:Imm63 family immunity protein n=1 Tax=Streptomyces noboritoensis TaxID=67337 RepID=A0ABV6TEP0_9ACTN